VLSPAIRIHGDARVAHPHHGRYGSPLYLCNVGKACLFDLGIEDFVQREQDFHVFGGVLDHFGRKGAAPVSALVGLVELQPQLSLHYGVEAVRCLSPLQWLDSGTGVEQLGEDHCVRHLARHEP
jgi:hypothetical protein